MRVAVLVLATAIALPGAAGAQEGGFHGRGHAENHDWYSGLNQPGTTYSCCNGDEHGGDCRPTRAYLANDGWWHAEINGRWTTVPKRAVLDKLAPDGASHICAAPNGYIFCFIGGSPKS
ncbi:MAG: hypothetical protein JSR47_03500 [Proteobacteria bacterium]|nr:hypothetical protein [Pseudomonadota bacterium]MBS0549036.1 hypothetical protein [Pseudomonadota bacterium]